MLMYRSLKNISVSCVELGPTKYENNLMCKRSVTQKWTGLSFSYLTNLNSMHHIKWKTSSTVHFKCKFLQYLLQSYPQPFVQSPCRKVLAFWKVMTFTVEMFDRTSHLSLTPSQLAPKSHPPSEICLWSASRNISANIRKSMERCQFLFGKICLNINCKICQLQKTGKFHLFGIQFNFKAII